MQVPNGAPLMHQQPSAQGQMYGQLPAGRGPGPAGAISSPYSARPTYAPGPPPQHQSAPQHLSRPQYQSGPSSNVQAPPQHATQYQGAPSPSHAQPAVSQYRSAPPPGFLGEGLPPAALGSKRRLDDGIAPEAKRPAPSSQPPRETIFRLLSSGRKIGAVIGRGGEIVKQLKAETGARIKVADAVPNCDERVVIMSSSPDPDVQWNCAQRALLEVHRRLLEGDHSMSAGSTAPVVTRFLVNQSQANNLLQRLDVTNMVRAEAGVDVKVLGPQELPACALSNDRVLQLTGTPQQLPRSLEILSQHFRENPPREKPGGAPPAIAALLARPGNVQGPPPHYGGPPPSYGSQPPHQYTPAPAPQYGAAAPGHAPYMPPPAALPSYSLGGPPQYGVPPAY
ncbi:TPA: hypothetical protein ACH3X2_013660 [Trebouxia sp. C0005]